MLLGSFEKIPHPAGILALDLSSKVPKEN